MCGSFVARASSFGGGRVDSGDLVRWSPAIDGVAEKVRQRSGDLMSAKASISFGDEINVIGVRHGH